MPSAFRVGGCRARSSQNLLQAAQLDGQEVTRGQRFRFPFTHIPTRGTILEFAFASAIPKTGNREWRQGMRAEYSMET
jgi:hypothetical protein